MIVTKRRVASISYLQHTLFIGGFVQREHQCQPKQDRVKDKVNRTQKREEPNPIYSGQNQYGYGNPKQMPPIAAEKVENLP